MPSLLFTQCQRKYSSLEDIDTTTRSRVDLWRDTDWNACGVVFLKSERFKEQLFATDWNGLFVRAWSWGGLLVSSAGKRPLDPTAPLQLPSIMSSSCWSGQNHPVLPLSELFFHFITRLWVLHTHTGYIGGLWHGSIIHGRSPLPFPLSNTDF